MHYSDLLKFSFIVSLVPLLLGCPLSPNSTTEAPPPKKPNPPKQVAADWQSELDESSLEERTMTTESGLRYVDILKGTGSIPQKGQIVSVHYTGRLKNGQKFDSSLDRGKPFEFTLGVGQVIKGWDEGLSTMQVGGKRKLFIPAQLGYGSRGVGSVIPPNSELHFDVELLGIK